MLTRRRVAGVAAAVCSVALVAGALWAPRLVRERVEAAARARGFDAKVGGVSLGFGSVALADVWLEAGKGNAVDVVLEDVRIDAGPFALALRGARAIEGVRVHRIAVKMRTYDSLPGVVDMLLRRRDGGVAESGADAGRGAATPLPSVAVESFDITLFDEQGALVDMKGSLDAARDVTRLTLDRLRVGGAPDANAELGRVSVELSRATGAVRIRRAKVGSVSVHLPAAQTEAESPEEPDAESPEEPEAEAPEEPAPPPPAKRATTLDRVRAALAKMRGTHAAGVGSTSSSAHAEGTSWVERLAPNAVLALTSARVLASDGSVIVDALNAEVSVARNRSLRLSGSGKAQGTGALHWNVNLWPEDLRADGEVELHALPLSLVAPFLPSVPWHEPAAARLDAELHVTSESLDRIAFDGEASLHGAAIASPRIAPEPVQGIDLALRGRGKWFPLARRLELAEGTVALGKTAAGLVGEVEMPADHYLFDLTAQLPPTPCTDAVLSIPPALLGDMRHARWQGRIGGTVHVRVDSRAFEATELKFDIEDHCEFTEVPLLADLRRFHEPFVHAVAEDDDTTFEMETGPGTPNWTRIEDVSPFFVHAVLAHEDSQFFSHHGFSPSHIRDALARDLEAGRYVVGASTITMQLVKNVFLRREKTLARKIQEVFLTWWVERVMPKRDILELYLNVIEYGPGVYGIRNAARHYFNRLPSELSPAESVYLSTILPGPKRYHAHFERGALPPGWKDRMRPIFERMRQRGWYSPEAAAYGLLELERFRFVPEGTQNEPREIPGTTAPLPYEGGEAALDAWEDMGEPTDHGEGGADRRRDAAAAQTPTTTQRPPPLPPADTGLEDGTEREPGATGTRGAQGMAPAPR